MKLNGGGKRRRREREDIRPELRDVERGKWRKKRRRIDDRRRTHRREGRGVEKCVLCIDRVKGRDEETFKS